MAKPGIGGGYVLSQTLKADGRFPSSDADEHWWIPSGRTFFHSNPAATAATELANARQNFFLTQRYRDPFGQSTTIAFDAPHNLLVNETSDALGNQTSVLANDYRVLQPRLMSDPNQNRSEVAFDILGLVVGTAVMGKAPPAAGEGDTLSGFVADLAPAQIDGFHDAADPHAIASLLLQGATTRVIYDLGRFQRTQAANPTDPTLWLAPYAAVLARETHLGAPLSPQGLKIQIGISFSDGFGREMQKKRQAEPGVLVDDGPIVNPRWVGSGWTVFNNKGKPVRQYEPFFSGTHHFEFGVKIGVSPILFYDPVERVVATLNPNHTWSKMVFGAWRQESWDLNDTSAIPDPKADPDVGDFFKRLPDSDYLPSWFTAREGGALGVDEQNAARRAAIHAATPEVFHADTLGRSFLSVAHNKFKYSDAAPSALPVEELYSTRILFDIEGRQREVRDALDRVIVHYDYGVSGSPIRISSMEAGQRFRLDDITGKPIRSWDSRNHTFRTTYDELRRALRSYVTGSDAGKPMQEVCFEKTVYGESGASGLTAAQILDANLRARPYQHFDTAGVVTNEAYDFKGNLLSSTRQLLTDYKATPDWASSPPPALNTEVFANSSRYDALNRPIQTIAPHSDRPGTHLNVFQPGYNEANLLDRVDAWLAQSATPSALLDPTMADLHAVTNIDYDARGRRTRIAYGNGATTDYTYDNETFRLIHLTTSRSGTVFQDLRYTFDPLGNITHIEDAAQQSIFFSGQVITPENDYIYDAIYRLINASGREHVGQLAQPQTSWNDEYRVNLPQPGDGQAMRNYLEKYTYDAVGNFVDLNHQAASANWSRAYAYNEASLIEPGKSGNRLSSTTAGGSTEPYTYDAHGNMTAMPHLTLMQWDFKDQLSATSRQVVNTGSAPDKVPETTFYVYDSGGQRVRKVTERQTGSRKDERVYLGGFEVYREFDSGGTGISLKRETLHVMDDKQRIGLIETLTQGNDGSSPRLVRYQLGNHLGSAALELSDAAQIISYEEYFPYGSTSYQAVDQAIKASAKRYRFTGKERDEETGFGYHGNRYYASWLQRWTSCDPVGIDDGVNIYCYVSNSPVCNRDPSGKTGLPAGTITAEGEIQKVDSFGKLQTISKTKEQFLPDGFKPPQGTIVVEGSVQVVDKKGGTLRTTEQSREYVVPASSTVKPAELADSGTPEPSTVALTGGYGFIGVVADHKAANAEALAIVGYDRADGKYAGILRGGGATAESHFGVLNPLHGIEGAGVVSATEDLQFFNSGDTKKEHVTIFEAETPKIKGVEPGIGGFVNNDDPRDVGVFVSGTVGPVTVGGGVTFHLEKDFEQEQREVLAKGGITLKRAPEGTLKPPSPFSLKAKLDTWLRAFGVDEAWQTEQIRRQNDEFARSGNSTRLK